MPHLFRYATTLYIKIPLCHNFPLCHNSSYRYKYVTKIWFIFPEIFSTLICKLVHPIKFFRLQHIPIQTFFHISTKIFHIFISHIWFINHIPFSFFLFFIVVYKPYTNKIYLTTSGSLRFRQSLPVFFINIWFINHISYNFPHKLNLW